MMNIRILLTILTVPLFLSISSFVPRIYNDTRPISVSGNEMVQITQWTPSDNDGPVFGKGRFFYSLFRSQYPVYDNNYLYEMYFISDSFYPPYMYQGGVATRSATKIDLVNLYVNGYPYINSLSKTSDFWLLFKGNYDAGIGDLGISFYFPSSNANVYIQWTEPKPY